jgi:hypothetical protein
MGVECSPNLSANTITMIVTGGTPPYTIKWSNGLIGPTLSNAVPGQTYEITVTDYSWPDGGPDYTAVTTCSLALPTPTPSPTPTPTPTPFPSNNTTLCLQVNSGRNYYQYQFSPSATIINGRSTWIYGPYVLSWNTNPNQWRVVMPVAGSTTSSVLTNSSNILIPTGTFQLYGSSNTAFMTNGACGNPLMTLNSPTIQTPVCENQPNTGSIYVNTVNGTPPILYSLNGGAQTQTNPLFSNKPPGTYQIWVQDSNSVTLTQTAIIPQPTTLNTYVLEINSSIVPQGSGNSLLNYTVKVYDNNGNQVTTLPSGTQISFDIQVNTIYSSTVQNGGSVNGVISVKKNNVTQSITPTVQTSNSTTAVNSTCPSQPTQFNTGTTRIYQGLTISGSDVISGTVQRQVAKIIPGNVCILKSTDTVSLINKAINGCTCCNVSSQSVDSVVMTTNAAK